jgi:hypothetical protein
MICNTLAFAACKGSGVAVGKGVEVGVGVIRCTIGVPVEANGLAQDVRTISNKLMTSRSVVKLALLGAGRWPTRDTRYERPTCLIFITSLSFYVVW